MKKNAPESTIVDTRSVKKFNGYSLYPREHFLSTNDNNRSLDSGLTNCYLDALSTDINLQVDETDIEWTFLTTESDRKEIHIPTESNVWSNEEILTDLRVERIVRKTIGNKPTSSPQKKFVTAKKNTSNFPSSNLPDEFKTMNSNQQEKKNSAKNIRNLKAPISLEVWQTLTFMPKPGAIIMQLPSNEAKDSGGYEILSEINSNNMLINYQETDHLNRNINNNNVMTEKSVRFADENINLHIK